MKSVKLTLIIAMLIFSLSGCVPKTIEQPEAPKDSQNDTVVEKTVIKAQSLPADAAGYNEVCSYVGDVDADGTDERIILSTEAERSSNGEFLWNDGQNWALYVEDTDGVYMLLDRFVQTGNIYFEVSDYYMENGAEPKILVTETTSAGFTLKTYSFSKDEGGYVEETVYDTANVTEAGINRRFSSFPEIME